MIEILFMQIAVDGCQNSKTTLWYWPWKAIHISHCRSSVCRIQSPCSITKRTAICSTEIRTIIYLNFILWRHVCVYTFSMATLLWCISAAYIWNTSLYCIIIENRLFRSVRPGYSTLRLLGVVVMRATLCNIHVYSLRNTSWGRHYPE